MPRHPSLRCTYHLVLGITSGFAVGAFVWMISGSDRLFWPYPVAGIVVMTAATLALARWKGGRLVHLLWIPVALFLALMAMVAIALRNFT
ncbi:MAG: hypothetical protein A2135_01740 [Actinobacteria bacterium RBG_16_67_15]|nr:MAG: hypothetical protein A2135_01740 [Actinobacteria bacterium RBG_16_67_15]